MAYQFSVIMPLFNAELYLEESVQCILNQSIGFKDHIQILFVDDGSSDRTEEICRKYVEHYPDNIQYVKQENGGVSSARNRGIEQAEGKYVVFFDYDDLWDEDAFEKIFSFYYLHEEVDVISCKMKYIGDFSGKTHPLNFKFKNGTCVVDLLEKPQYVNSTIGNMVYRRTAIRERRFDTRLPTGEDATFTNLILLNNPHLGIIADTVFYYRRNRTEESVSTSAPNRKTWYFEVPENYYLILIAASKLLYKRTIPFIQEVILYDMRWRHYNEKMMGVLSEDEKARHIDIMHRVVSELDDERITKYEVISQYRRLYYFYLKYGSNLVEDATYLEGRAYYQDTRILNYRAKSMLQIVTIHVKDDVLWIDGFHRLHNILSELYLKVRDERGREYDFEQMPYEDANQRGYIGEWIAFGNRFQIGIPIHKGIQIGFFVDFGDEEWQMKPEFWSESGLEQNRTYTFCRKDMYLVRFQDKWIKVFKYDKKKYLYLKRRYLLSALYRKKRNLYDRKRNRIELERIKYSLKPGKQVAFITARSNDHLLPNLRAVYEKYPGKKIIYTKMSPYSQNDLKEMAEAFYSSRVVVTDDYLYLLRLLGKRDDQKVVQIWHAAGAFKKFGLDGTSLYPSIDSSYHKDYDLVSVSSEEIRSVYAHAFDLPVECVRALGVPRTDCMFSEEYISAVTDRILGLYPELDGKQIFLYAPTFRDGSGLNKREFKPKLDFVKLCKSLREDQVFVICPHPVMSNDILEDVYDNLFVIRDIPTNDMMYVADVLITDYSSVIFEFAVLNKPIIFYCYDYDDYNRDFYLDYEKELPGELLRTEEELLAYLEKDEFYVDKKMRAFYEKYMRACDGHSAERVVKAIQEMMQRDSDDIR